MGCDIHAHGEVKINGIWRHWSQPNIHRSYNLFAKMADVRNDETIDPISKPRGLPEDVTYETKFDSDYMGTDGHSHSWLSCEELDEVGKWYEAKRKEWNPGNFYSFEYHTIGYLFSNGWNVKKYPESNPPGVEDARLVFWFDN